jgi:phage terminase large subunit
MVKASRVYDRIQKSEKRIVINRGGTRSTKTYSAMLYAVHLLFNSKGIKLEVCRKYLPSLKASAYEDFLEIIRTNTLSNGMPYEQLLSVNLTELRYSYGPNTIQFFGLDNEQKIRSRKRDIIFIIEANEISYKEFQQIAVRTTGQIFLDLNPDDENIWINTELEQKRAAEIGDVEVIVSTYLDNPFLGEEQVREIETLRVLDPQAWKVFGEGEYGNVVGRVFDWKVEKWPEHYTRVGLGLDFGFTNDPTAVVEVAKSNGRLHVRELLYQHGLTNPDIVQRLDIDRQEEVVCDSAEPKSIEEIKRIPGGFRASPARKGPDSIRQSIDILKRYELVVDPGSVNLLKELRSYKWQTDRNGENLNKPVDYMNHAIDALRYVALNKLNTNKSGVYAVR